MIKLLSILLFIYFLAPNPLLSQEIKAGGVFLFVAIDEKGEVVNSQLSMKTFKKDKSLLIINLINNGYNFIIEYDKKALLTMRLYLSGIQNNGVIPKEVITLPVQISTLHKKSKIDTEFSCFINDEVNLKVGCIFLKIPGKKQFYITSLETLLKIVLSMGA